MPLAVTRCRITDALFDLSVSGRCSRRASAPLPVIERPPPFLCSSAHSSPPPNKDTRDPCTSLLYAIFVVK